MRLNFILGKKIIEYFYQTRLINECAGTKKKLKSCSFKVSKFYVRCKEFMFLITDLNP